uniref:protein AF-9-like isoform X1 n=2 Tax=Myxine glutinosa TaxID=7769 RepID=UPI0035900A23
MAFNMASAVLQVQIELGHFAIVRKKVSAEGYTHDWRAFVRGVDHKKIHGFVEKVVFILHASFLKPKRVYKEPPYEVEESGYAGFVMPVHIYFKNTENPRKMSFEYDLFLQTPGQPPVSHVRCEKLIFNCPSPEFHARLLKAGAVSTGLVKELKLPSNSKDSAKKEHSKHPKEQGTKHKEKKPKNSSCSVEKTNNTNHKKVHKEGASIMKGGKSVHKLNREPDTSLEKWKGSGIKRPAADVASEVGATKKNRTSLAASDKISWVVLPAAPGTKCEDEQTAKQDKCKNRGSDEIKKHSKYKIKLAKEVVQKQQGKNFLVKPPQRLKTDGCGAKQPGKYFDLQKHKKHRTVHNVVLNKSRVGKLEARPQTEKVGGFKKPMSAEKVKDSKQVVSKSLPSMSKVEDVLPMVTAECSTETDKGGDKVEGEVGSRCDKDYQLNQFSKEATAADWKPRLTEQSGEEDGAEIPKANLPMPQQDWKQMLKLQEQLSCLKERDVLQQVVDLIEKTSRFQVTCTTFDFNLSALEPDVIKKLWNCFPSSETERNA